MSERIVSGSVRGDGSTAQGHGFHVSRKSCGHYLVVFQPPLHIVRRGDVQLIGDRHGSSLSAVLRSYDGLHALIEVAAADGAAQDADFSFVFCGQAHSARGDLAGQGVGGTMNVVADPAIGSPPPVLNFPPHDRSPQASTGDRSWPVHAEPLVAAQQEQIARLQAMMRDVLQPLQAENKMLRSRLSLLKQQKGEAPPPASDRLPVTYGLPAALALAKLFDRFEFETVLDLGPGWQERAAAMLAAGRAVTTVLPEEAEADGAPQALSIRRGTIHSALLPVSFDCIIAAHVLHRERDPQRFLRRLHDLLPERSILAITVPALRYPMLHGELSIWSAGLLLYHLILAGFNCGEAKVLTQGEEISVILEKETIEAWGNGDPLPPLASLRRYLPSRVDFVLDPACFNGDIVNLDW
ncbi:methyltransferase domain-containing protein [Rhizobium sp. SSA_523]|uniref:methyltransferase domain-containing protein n=1 Tax=Rhizobium sp. SSA_523 TaxID=2952477 RepID=UPI00209149CE|nr:class I SAM-dependent methyltransferase [Rhizobium sp. SSA_523]MCO5733859.1 class I SAM-dependent methyltransferase [Rhizobium sp. SSA_523]WKC24874.1 class I SAM-dependent methyltransferase [Rhizobium sp. SSA_523]